MSGRIFVFLAAIIGLGEISNGTKLLRSNGMGQESKQQNPMLMNELVTSLVADEQAFFAPPLFFSYWVRGGDPGEGFTSDKLDVKCEKQDCNMVYIRTRFDEQLSPPYLSEQFSSVLPLSKASDLLKMVFCSDLFRRDFPAEVKPPVADILKESWIFSRLEMHVEKTLFEPFPETLASLQRASRDLMEVAAKHGSRVVLSQKGE
jgi:hypothetical protein